MTNVLLPPIGSMVRWSEGGRSSLLKEVVMYREFNGILYALLVWTAYGNFGGRPLCTWIKASDLSKYYEVVEL